MNSPGASRRAAHDRAANRPQAHDHRCGVRCAVALHLRHDEGKEPLFPDFDYKQFVVECFFPSASDANIVRDRLLTMSDRLMENPAIDRVAISQGSALPITVWCAP